MARQRTLSPAQGAATGKHRLAKDADPDEDVAKTESQQILAFGSLLKKQKVDDKDAHHFRAKVATDRKKLKARLDQKVHEAQKQEMQRRNEITLTILDALKTPHRPVKGKTTTFASTTIAKNAAYIPIVEILAASEGLSREYKRLDKTITDRYDENTEPVAEIWHQGIEETERQLKMGARVALRNVKKVLGADVERVMTKDGEEEMHESERAGQELSYELQKSLRYVERGVKRMVKGIPNDEPQ